MFSWFDDCVDKNNSYWFQFAIELLAEEPDGTNNNNDTNNAGICNVKN